jgi:hypothetical protein
VSLYYPALSRFVAFSCFRDYARATFLHVALSRSHQIISPYPIIVPNHPPSVLLHLLPRSLLCLSLSLRSPRLVVRFRFDFAWTITVLPISLCLLHTHNLSCITLTEPRNGSARKYFFPTFVPFSFYFPVRFSLSFFSTLYSAGVFASLSNLRMPLDFEPVLSRVVPVPFPCFYELFLSPPARLN